jgi:hypothetical protein
MLALSVQKVTTSPRDHLQSTILQTPPTSHCFRQTVQHRGNTRYLGILGIIGDISLLVKYPAGCEPLFPQSGAKESLKRETCDEQERVHPNLNLGDKRLTAREQQCP